MGDHDPQQNRFQVVRESRVSSIQRYKKAQNQSFEDYEEGCNLEIRGLGGEWTCL